MFRIIIKWNCSFYTHIAINGEAGRRKRERLNDDVDVDRK